VTIAGSVLLTLAGIPGWFLGVRSPGRLAPRIWKEYAMSLCHHPYKSVAFALAIGALGALSLVPVSAQKGKTSSPPDSTVTVTFADRDGDAMVSDGGGAYAAKILGNSGDLRLELGPIGRTIEVKLGAPISINPDFTSADVPNGVDYLTDGVLFVENVRSVAVNTTAMLVGRIGLRSAYPNHAVGFREKTVGEDYIGGTPVCVTRTGPKTWHITSSCTGDGDTAGLFEENLKGKISVRFKATYSVPFAAKVTCMDNCP
jgi:hypothetical protein